LRELAFSLQPVVQSVPVLLTACEEQLERTTRDCLDNRIPTWVRVTASSEGHLVASTVR
jgi:hypothetical protein